MSQLPRRGEGAAAASWAETVMGLRGRGGLALGDQVRTAPIPQAVAG
ncbi:MAG: hypothetical protein IPH72_15985 [Sandaracinaceae bacterium]|nr:hypothetical protein [Sandaracinaceae bacterium]